MIEIRKPQTGLVDQLRDVGHLLEVDLLHRVRHLVVVADVTP